MVDTNLSSRLELYISCRKLPNKDTFSKSDPFVVVALKDVISGEFKEIDRSAVMKDNLNPDFTKQFLVDYFFEENQTLQVWVYDSDSSSTDLKKHDKLGYVECLLGEIVAAPGQVRAMSLLVGKEGKTHKEATVIVRAEEVSTNRDVLKVTLRGEKLDKKDFFGKSDPYLEFYRLREDNTYLKVFTTEIIKNTLNPLWKTIEIPLQILVNGDVHRPMMIKCWDWDSSSAHDLIGECQVSVHDMMSAASFAMELVNPELKAKKKGYKNSGTLIVQNIFLEKNPSFLEYIKGGCNISLMVAIDFTGSNGDPTAPGTLHYRYGLEPNQYQQAIRTIGTIVAPYDSDQMFAAWGFGARVDGVVNHCFPLNGDATNPEVRGVEGILAAYESCFSRIALSGPTLFTQILTSAAKIAASKPLDQKSQHYTILLILTDGVINDMDSTIKTVVDASKYPLSVIIVGVGDADFSQMEALDSDEKKLSFGGKTAERDIVQFVPFKKFSEGHVSQLAKETLVEVPRQLLDLFKQKKINPNPPREAPAAIGTLPPKATAPAKTEEKKDDGPPSYDAFAKA